MSLLPSTETHSIRPNVSVVAVDVPVDVADVDALVETVDIAVVDAVELALEVCVDNIDVVAVTVIDDVAVLVREDVIVDV
jgi:hypothetical protein